MSARLSDVGKDITELKTLSGSGVEAVRGELDDRLNKAEKRVVDIEGAFAGLKERLEEVGRLTLNDSRGDERTRWKTHILDRRHYRY